MSQLALTDDVSISLITAVAAVTMSALASVVSAVSAYFAHKARVSTEKTHTVVNSRMTEFMEMAKKSYQAEGKLAGKAEATAERDAKDKVHKRNKQP